MSFPTQHLGHHYGPAPTNAELGITVCAASPFAHNHNRCWNDCDAPVVTNIFLHPVCRRCADFYLSMGKQVVANPEID